MGASTLNTAGVLFVVLAIGVLGGGLAVVTLRNIIHSAVAMMVCFGSLAGMYALLGAPIVAAAQVLIYLGAISVLILFAIMLTQAGDANLPAPFHQQVPFAALAAIVVAGLIGWAAVTTDWGAATDAVAVGVQALATALFDRYALPFEIISLLLLVAIIGAIFLARRPEEDERAQQRGTRRLPGRLGHPVRDRRVRLHGAPERDPDADQHRADAERVNLASSRSTPTPHASNEPARSSPAGDGRRGRRGDGGAGPGDRHHPHPSDPRGGRVLGPQGMSR